MSYNSYCRLCATYTSEVNLVDILGNKNDLELKIAQCFQLKIENDNFLPKQACIVCSSRVHSYYDFFVQVSKAQLVFKSNDETQIPIIFETKVEIDDDEVDMKFDLHNSNSSDKFSGDENDEGSGVSDEDFDADIDDIKIEPTSRMSSSRPAKKNESDAIIQEESVSDIEEIKEAFYKKLSEMSIKHNSHLLSDEMYARLIREVEAAETKSSPNVTLNYRRLKRFEVLKTDNGGKKLIERRKKPTDKIKYFVPKSEMFDLIREAHMKCNHGGRCRTYTILKMKYKNITCEVVMIYLFLCKVCEKRKKSVRERMKLKPKRIQKKASDENDEGSGVSDEDFDADINDIKIEPTSRMSSSRTTKKDEDDTITQEETATDIEEVKEAFYKKLSEMSVKNNSHLISDEMYARLIREVEESEAKTTLKVAINYRRLKRFEVLKTDNGIKKLIARRKKPTDKIKYFVPKSEMFELIRDAHMKCNHGGRCRTDRILKMKYKNITREVVMIYLSLCKVCRKRKKSVRERMKLKAKENQEKAVTKPPPPSLKCNECGDMFHSANDLRDHFETVHDKPVEFVCLECSKLFNNYITFRNHLWSHKNEFRFRCEICTKFFSSNRKLQEHKQRHSKTRRKYFCSTCGKGFLNENYLSIHAQRAHSKSTLNGDGTDPVEKDDVAKTHECDECHKMFASISSLNNHKKVHTGVREHTCEHCGKSFIYKKYLDDHITSHSDERPFKCNMCPASFKAKMYLRRHVFLHTGVKPYQCHVCGKKFPRKPALIEHSITHTDLYPFKCEICEKGFRSKKNVVWHQRLHTGEKPYSCETCNRHFTCSSNYDKHMKRHHGVVKVKKEVPIIN